MEINGPVLDTTPLSATYIQTAPPPLDAPTLVDRLKVDVAVVGGGYTGLSTALRLAESGGRVAVLEAREVGWGGSGRAFGQVVPYAKHDDAAVLKHFGPQWGERLVAGLAGGPDLVFGLITQHEISCEAVRAGLIFAAHNQAAIAGLDQRARFWRDRGADVELVARDVVIALTGSRYYEAALLDHRGGTLNPLGYARGLAWAAIRGGAMLFENSRVIGLNQTGGGWRLVTARGEVNAAQVVLATDAYTDDLWPGLRQSLIPLRAYQLVSAPLSENLRRSVLPGGQSLSDTRRLYSGIRRRADGRLHLSVDGPAFSNTGTAFAAKSSKRLRDLFPQIGELAWEHAVAGWVGMTEDQYPHIHRLAPGLIAAIGLSGRGIAFGTLLGRDVFRRLTGVPEHDWMLPDTPLRPIRVKPVARPLVGALLNTYRLLDRWDLRHNAAG